MSDKISGGCNIASSERETLTPKVMAERLEEAIEGILERHDITDVVQIDGSFFFGTSMSGVSVFKINGKEIG